MKTMNHLGQLISGRSLLKLWADIPTFRPQGRMVVVGELGTIRFLTLENVEVFGTLTIVNRGTLDVNGAIKQSYGVT